MEIMVREVSAMGSRIDHEHKERIEKLLQEQNEVQKDVGWRDR